MRSLLLAWHRRRMVGVTAVIAVGHAGISLLVGGVAVADGLPLLRPAMAIPVALPLVFGPAAAWGAAIGVVFTNVVHGVVGPSMLFDFLGTLAIGVASYTLWGTLGPVSSGGPPQMRSASQFVEFVAVATVAGALGSAIIAWGLELLGLFPFFITAIRTFASTVIPAVVFGPPLLYALYPHAARRGLTYHSVMDVGTSTEEYRRKSFSAGAAIVIIVVWFTVGIVASIGTYVFEAIPVESLAKHVSGRIAHEKGRLLQLGWIGQGVLGTVAFFFLLRYGATLDAMNSGYRDESETG